MVSFFAGVSAITNGDVVGGVVQCIGKRSWYEGWIGETVVVCVCRYISTW